MSEVVINNKFIQLVYNKDLVLIHLYIADGSCDRFMCLQNLWERVEMND